MLSNFKLENAAPQLILLLLF